jgi:hypothetical protein
MDRKTGEVFSAMGEFLCDCGQWSNVCQYMQERGLTPQQIADACNAAAAAAGNTDRLTAADCE